MHYSSVLGTCGPPYLGLFGWKIIFSSTVGLTVHYSSVTSNKRGSNTPKTWLGLTFNVAALPVLWKVHAGPSCTHPPPPCPPYPRQQVQLRRWWRTWGQPASPVHKDSIVHTVILMCDPLPPLSFNISVSSGFLFMLLTSFKFSPAVVRIKSLRVGDYNR